jgi:molybdenum cofactor cytidylyltransferase/nicotine blue oxidoreductase
MGRPKALVRDATGEPWLVRGVRALRNGGCDAVTVVLGASADEAVPLLAGTGAAYVLAADWAEGMAASLRTGLASVADGDAEAAVVSLVDLPDVGPAVVRRVTDLGTDPGTLARASYDGAPGHPVLLGRDHWHGVIETATGDRGARDYLATHAVFLVECGDLATGRDQDTPRS